VLEIEQNHNDGELNNSNMVDVFEKDQAPFDFDPHSNLNVNAILKKVVILPRIGSREKSTRVDYLFPNSK